MKRTKLIWIICLSVLIFSITFYFLYFSKPNTFPRKKEIKEEINVLFPAANVKEIKDVVMIDETHIFVPFISHNNSHGMSYWVWKMNDWKLEVAETKGAPKLWRIDTKDQAMSYLVWHIDPDDKLETLRFVLMQKRNYQMTDGKETYDPEIQMEKSINLNKRNYGVLKLPSDWVAYLDDYLPTKYYNHRYSSPLDFISIGWIPYNIEGKESFPGESVNGSLYHLGSEAIEHLVIYDEKELIYP